MVWLEAHMTPGGNWISIMACARAEGERSTEPKSDCLPGCIVIPFNLAWRHVNFNLACALLAKTVRERNSLNSLVDVGDALTSYKHARTGRISIRWTGKETLANDDDRPMNSAGY